MAKRKVREITDAAPAKPEEPVVVAAAPPERRDGPGGRRPRKEFSRPVIRLKAHFESAEAQRHAGVWFDRCHSAVFVAEVVVRNITRGRGDVDLEAQVRERIEEAKEELAQQVARLDAEVDAQGGEIEMTYSLPAECQMLASTPTARRLIELLHALDRAVHALDRAWLCGVITHGQRERELTAATAVLQACRSAISSLGAGAMRAARVAGQGEAVRATIVEAREQRAALAEAAAPANHRAPTAEEGPGEEPVPEKDAEEPAAALPPPNGQDRGFLWGRLGAAAAGR